MIAFDGDKLKQLRIEKGLTQEHLSADADLGSGSHVCKLEKGEIPKTNIEICWKLAQFFKVPMETFVKQV